ncbi:hypothetical protein FRC17_006816 [Serendipita sp. 399]|nr:hypothetical protein FRC17_006816 [Serendipita sp. 399]
MSNEEAGSQKGPKLSHETPSSSTKVSSGLQARQTIQTPHLVEPSIPENLGIVKTTLNDIEDAMANGTLKPLPPDLAARLKKAAEGDANATSGIDTVQVWWHKLKEMTKFYFFGVVALGREHRIRAKETRRRLRESESQGIKGVQEWRHNDFLQTYRIDLMRLVPFVSIILILEEVLPLIILYAPFLLPSTCKLPSQAKRIDELADRKRWDALVSLGNLLKIRDGVSGARSSVSTPLSQERSTTETQLDGLPEGSLSLLCRVLGLAPYGPSLYLRSRLRSTLATLSEEDSYFRSTSSPATSGSSADPVSHLSLSELRLILRRRGFPTSPLSLPQLRDNLTWWLSHPEDQTEKRLAALVALARSSTRVPGGPPPSSRKL